MIEVEFSRSFKKHFLAHHKLNNAVIINNNFTSGIPDLYLEGVAQDMFIESKFIREFPKRPTTHINLADESKYVSRLQANFLKKKAAKGLLCGVLAGFRLTAYGKVSCVFFEGTSWLNSYTAEYYTDMCLPTKAMATKISEQLMTK